MTDHPVLIPTSEGPVGGVVSEPRGEPRAALILLAGYGRPARSGVNSVWARLARRLSERGVLVLRADYAGEGETLPIGGAGSAGQDEKRQLDLRLFRQVLPWFRRRASSTPLFFAGLCSGARGAIELAAGDPESFAGAFLVVPHWRGSADTKPPGAVPLRGAKETGFVDPQLVDALRSLLSHAPCWLLVGENDTTADIPLLREALQPAVHELEVEVVENTALHLVDQPQIQQQVEARLLARVERALAGPAGSANQRPRESAWT